MNDTVYDSIDVYVWNGNMKPYAEVKQIEKIKENPIEISFDWVLYYFFVF